MNKSSKIFVAGHKGLVGSAIVRLLTNEGYTHVVSKERSELDLTNQLAVQDFFHNEKIEYVFLAAAKVGGILANSTYPADFIRDNLMIQSNVIDSAYRNGVSKLLFLGSSCIYPKYAPQPMKEEHLLTGMLEPTNEWYAIAKIAGIKMCQAYRRQFGFQAISIMPTNLFGPGDNFDLHTSHVLPALIRKFHEAKEHNAKEVVVWGTGTPMREFLHVEDMARACVFLMEHYNEEDIINVGTGQDISIRDLSLMIKDIVGFKGDLVFDTQKPDGTPRKLLDVSKLNALGWKPAIPLATGISSTYEWYLKHGNKKGNLYEPSC